MLLFSATTMDPIKIEKLQAMKRYRMRNQFLPTLIQYILSVLVLGLFLSILFWIPSVCFSIRNFFIVSLPQIAAIVMGPKCLFVVCNIIIVFLVSESKFSRSASAPDVYEEYVKRNQSLRMLSNREAKAKETVIDEIPSVEYIKEKVEEVEEEEELEEKGDGEEESSMDCEDLDGEEEVSMECEDLDGEEVVAMECENLEGEEEERGLPADELNQKVESFIARVNMERMVEAKMLVCYG